MEDNFSRLLQTLLDEKSPLPSTQLAGLSDLDTEHIEQFQLAWQQFTTPRKRDLINALGQESDLHIELNYEAINRIVLDDPDDEVRCIAIRNLWECQDPGLVMPLIKAVRTDESAKVRSTAATALGSFVWLGEIDEIDSNLLSEIEESLLAAIDDDEAEEVRRRSLESLGYSSRTEIPALIKQAYSSGKEALIQSALFAMGRSVSDQWSSIVITELNNPSPRIRLEAARAAGELELKEAVDPLIELLDDVKEDVRDAVIWSLGQLGGDAAADALLRLLDSTEDDALADFIDEALDHLAFVDGTRHFLLIEFDDFEDPES